MERGEEMLQQIIVQATTTKLRKLMCAAYWFFKASNYCSATCILENVTAIQSWGKVTSKSQTKKQKPKKQNKTNKQ